MTKATYSDIKIIQLPDDEDKALDFILSHKDCPVVKIIGKMKEWYIDLNNWIDENEIVYLDLYELTEMTEWGDPVEYVDGPSGGIFWCESLQEVVLPKNLKGLGSRYFEGCSNLDTIHIPASLDYLGIFPELPPFPDSTLKKVYLELSSVNSWILAKYSGIDVEYTITEDRFEERDGILYDVEDKKLLRCFKAISGTYKFPENISSVADYAFFACKVNKIIIPAWVKEFAFGVFWKAIINELFIEEGVESLGKYMFSNAIIGRINLPSTLKSIGIESFIGLNPDAEIVINKSNDTLDIEDGVVYNKIDSSAVGFILGRNTYKVREGTKVIASSAFSFEHSKDKYKKYNSDEMLSFQLPASLEYIHEKAFCYTPISDISLPVGLKSIGDSAFTSTYLADLVVPDSVIEIGNSAFSFCSSLETVRLSVNLTNISEYLFYSCRLLKSISIPNSVTTISSCAFSSCESLMCLRMPLELTAIYGMVFEKCRSLETVHLNEKLETLGDGAFWQCEKLSNIEIPESVTYLGSYAFKGCKSLQRINLPSQCEIWSPNDMFQFEGCDNLHDFSVSEDNPHYTISNGILYNKTGEYLIKSFTERNIIEPLGRTKEIGPMAFENTPCKAVFLPDSVLKIGARAFADCESLEHIRFSRNVKEIVVEKYYTENFPGEHEGPFGKLFDGCKNLSVITNISKKIRETYPEIFENIKEIEENITEEREKYKDAAENNDECISELHGDIVEAISSSYYVDPKKILTYVSRILKGRNDQPVEHGAGYLNDMRKLLEALRDNLQFLGIIPSRCRALNTGLRILENSWPDEIIPKSIRNRLGETQKIVNSGSHYSSNYKRTFYNYGYSNNDMVDFAIEIIRFNKNIHDYYTKNKLDPEYFVSNYESLIYGGVNDMNATVAVGIVKYSIRENRETGEMERMYFVEDRDKLWQRITLYEKQIFDYYRKTGRVIKDWQEVRIRFKEIQKGHRIFWVATEIIGVVQREDLINIGNNLSSK